MMFLTSCHAKNQKQCHKSLNIYMCAETLFQMKKSESADSLESLWEEIWALLGRGAAFPKDPWHAPQLSTIASSGPKSRIVILRKADKGKSVLICHTDIRAQKVKEIQRNANISWLFWNARARIQLRLEATAVIHHMNSQAAAHWDSLSASSRTTYSLTEAPGTEVPSDHAPLISFDRDLSPSAEKLNAWYNHFAVIETTVQAVEWLELHREGHRRAQFTRQESSWRMYWMIP